MITLSVNVTKIDKTALIDGKNGKYLSLVLFENKKGIDQYGNAGFITQDLGRERREKGEKGEILGNYKVILPRHQQAPAQSQSQQTDSWAKDEDDSIPF